MTTPKRKILRTYGNPLNTRTRAGVIKTATLECGHVESVTASDRRKGWIYCFDCFYGKPLPSYTAISSAEFEAFCLAHDGEPMAGRPAKECS